MQADLKKRVSWSESSLGPGCGPDLKTDVWILVFILISLVFLSFSLSRWFGVCCLTFVLLVGLWVFTFSLSLLSCVVVVVVMCDPLDLFSIDPIPLF